MLEYSSIRRNHHRVNSRRSFITYTIRWFAAISVAIAFVKAVATQLCLPFSLTKPMAARGLRIQTC